MGGLSDGENDVLRSARVNGEGSSSSTNYIERPGSIYSNPQHFPQVDKRVSTVRRTRGRSITYKQPDRPVDLRVRELVQAGVITEFGNPSLIKKDDPSMRELGKCR